MLRRRRHPQGVFALFHLRAQLAQLGGHRRDAIGLFDPPTANIAQHTGAVGVERRYRNRHCRIGNMIEIGIDGLQDAVRLRFYPVIPRRNRRAHLPQRVYKLHIALNTVQPYPLHPHRAAGNGPGRQKIRGRRSVAFNMDAARTDVMLPCRQRETAPVVTYHFDAEAAHQIKGNLDIRL